MLWITPAPIEGRLYMPQNAIHAMASKDEVETKHSPRINEDPI
jgi:hypothetical protein